MYIKKTIPADAAESPRTPVPAPNVGQDSFVDVSSREVLSEVVPRKGLGAFMSTKKPSAPLASPAVEAGKGIFSKLKGNREPRPEVVEGGSNDAASPPAAKKFGLMAGFGTKKGRDATRTAADSGPKPTAIKKPLKKPVSTAKQIAVLVELEDGKQVCWNVTSSGMTSIELEDSARALSFSPRDLRYATSGAISTSAAQALVLSEIGEAARTLNTSKNLRAVYATSAERTKSFGQVNVGPGLLVLETLLQEATSVEEDRICGLQLMDTDGSLGLVVLYHFSANGDVGDPQVTVNPTDLSFVLAQFVSSRRLDPDTTKVVLVKNDDLLNGLSHFKTYPNQATMLGFPVSRLLNGAALFSILLAFGSAGYAGYGYILKSSSTLALAEATSTKNQALKEADTLLGSSIRSFAQTQALDLDALMANASRVWVPGSVVQMDATARTARYAVRMPMLRGSNVGSRPSVLDRAEQAQVNALINFAAPENCSKSILNFSGALNAAQINVECENGPGRLSAYFLE